MSALRAGRSDPGVYPERAPSAEGALDRIAGTLGFHLQQLFRRSLPEGPPLEEGAARHAERLREQGPQQAARELRYRLRRDGLDGERLLECFALYGAVQGVPCAEALRAAGTLVGGGIVDADAPAVRWQALALSATAFALCGVPVHLYTAGDARARAAADALRTPLEALGMRVGCVAPDDGEDERRAAYGASVTCGTQRLIGFDYLRDRLKLGRPLRALQGRIEWLAEGGAPLRVGGLHCALVEDADVVLLDDARLPLVASAEVGSPVERLPYEQALELAGALTADGDFILAEQGARLTPMGARRLAELCVLLGGLWTARQRREELVEAALTVLHAMERGRDYDLERGELRLPEAQKHEAPLGETLQRLLEVKEGVSFAGRRETLARLTVPRYFRRYLRLAGVCADASGLERELWSFYGLHTRRAGPPPARAAWPVHVLPTAEARRAAIAKAAAGRAARGESVLVAARAPEEAAACQERGLPALLYPAHRAGAPRATHLIVADLHDASRHVRQIAQACGATSLEQFLDLEDKQVAAAGSGAAAQRLVERAAAQARKDLVAREQAHDELLSFSGRAT